MHLHQLAKESSKGSLCGGRHDSVAEESQLVGAIVCGDVQLGIVQPMGKPISVSTQRGLSLPQPIAFASSLGSIECSFFRLPDPPARPLGPPWSQLALGVGHVTISFKFFTPWPLALIAAICSGVFGPWASWAWGVAQVAAIA